MGEYEFEDEDRKFQQQEEDHTHNDSSPQPPPPPPVDEEDLTDSKSNVFFLIHRSFIFQFQSIRVFLLYD